MEANCSKDSEDDASASTTPTIENDRYGRVRRLCCVCAKSMLTTRRRCPNCECETCVVCIERYLSETHFVLNAKCLNCSSAWTDLELLLSIASENFIERTWKDRLSRALYERDKPEFVKIIAKIEKDRILRAVQHGIRTIRSINGELGNGSENIEGILSMNNIPSTVLSTLEVYTIALGQCIHVGNEFLTKLRECSRKISSKLSPVTSFRCDSESCSGYVSVVNSGEDRCKFARCAHCEKMHCIECRSSRDIETTNHVCDAKIAKNIALIESSTTACPTCASPIEKINGCNEMFCPLCATSFEWKFGNVLYNPRHNPDRDDYIRTLHNGILPRAFGDIECGGLLELTTLNDVQKNYVTDDVIALTNLVADMYESCITWSSQDEVETRENDRERLQMWFIRNTNETYDNDSVYSDDEYLTDDDDVESDDEPELEVVLANEYDNPILVDNNAIDARDADVQDVDPDLIYRGTMNWYVQFPKIGVSKDSSLDPIDQYRNGILSVHVRDEVERKYNDALFTFVDCANGLLRDYFDRVERTTKEDDDDSNAFPKKQINALIRIFNERAKTLSNVYRVPVRVVHKIRQHGNDDQGKNEKVITYAIRLYGKGRKRPFHFLE